MRKIFTVVGCLVAVSGFSQLQVGTRLLSGQLGFNSSTSRNSNQSLTNKTEQSGVNLEFGVQKLYKTNRIQGFSVGVGFGNSKVVVTNSGTSMPSFDSKDRTVGLNYFEQYLLPFGEKWYGTVTINGRLGYTYGRQVADQSTRKDDTYAVSLGLSPGVSYHFHKRWLADLQLANLGALSLFHERQRELQPSEPRSKQTSFDFSSSLRGSTAVSIGFRYLLL